MSSAKLEAAYDLFRRLPPSQLETNLSFVSEMLSDDDADDLLQTVDAPLKLKSTSSGDFVISDYNRDGDSYRSPYDNNYYPPLEGGESGVKPPKRLRDMEQEANKIFQVYTQHYYGENGVSSCYFWEIEGGFAVCVLIHKDGKSKRVEKGIWDSIHVVSVTEKGNSAKYQLSTTIILTMKTKENNLDLSGSIQKQDVRDNVKVSKFQNHITNIGNLIQDMENALRDSLQYIYFDKAREITRTLRSTESQSVKKNKRILQNELFAAIANRKR